MSSAYAPLRQKSLRLCTLIVCATFAAALQFLQLHSHVCLECAQRRLVGKALPRRVASVFLCVLDGELSDCKMISGGCTVNVRQGMQPAGHSLMNAIKPASSIVWPLPVPSLRGGPVQMLKLPFGDLVKISRRNPVLRVINGRVPAYLRPDDERLTGNARLGMLSLQRRFSTGSCIRKSDEAGSLFRSSSPRFDQV
jgi:hypothetical protein